MLTSPLCGFLSRPFVQEKKNKTLTPLLQWRGIKLFKLLSVPILLLVMNSIFAHRLRFMPELRLRCFVSIITYMHAWLWRVIARGKRLCLINGKRLDVGTGSQKTERALTAHRAKTCKISFLKKKQNKLSLIPSLSEVRAGTMEGHADKMCPSITPVRDTTAALLTQ